MLLKPCLVLFLFPLLQLRACVSDLRSRTPRRSAPVGAIQRHDRQCDDRLLFLPRVSAPSADGGLGRAVAGRARPCIHVCGGRARHGQCVRHGRRVAWLVDSAQCDMPANVFRTVSRYRASSRHEHQYHVPEAYECESLLKSYSSFTANITCSFLHACFFALHRLQRPHHVCDQRRHRLRVAKPVCTRASGRVPDCHPRRPADGRGRRVRRQGGGGGH